MKIISTRLRMPYAGAVPVPDPFGIRCVAVLGDEGQLPLILIADTDENDGTSATHAMAGILAMLAEDWPGFPVRNAIIVCKDSMEYFDLIVPHWYETTFKCSVDYSPLRHFPAPPRSKEAFEMLYGDCARAALAHLE